MPLYSDWPEPSAVWISCSARRTAPVVASTYVASRDGVPSDWVPPLSTFQASRGVAPVASTRSCGVPVVF